MTLIVIRGVGEIGSVVALTLFRAGHRVVLHDLPRPAHARRAVAFTDALFDGRATLDGTTAKYARSSQDIPYMVACGRAVPVCDHAFDSLVAALHPDVLIDARMRKRIEPEPQRGLAPLTIGLGPNFVAGATTDVVIETAHGPQTGRVMDVGRAEDFAGEPQPLGGHGRERFVYAPTSGTFHTALDVSAWVTAGAPIASIGGCVLRAPLTGWLRGLAHDGADVERDAKIIEVDASASPESVGRIGERARRIAEGVLTAIQRV